MVICSGVNVAYCGVCPIALVNLNTATANCRLMVLAPSKVAIWGAIKPTNATGPMVAVEKAHSNATMANIMPFADTIFKPLAVANACPMLIKVNQRERANTAISNVNATTNSQTAWLPVTR